VTSKKAHKTPTLLEKHLQGLEFPAGKEELLLRAQANQAPDEVMTAIFDLPDREFNSIDELIRGGNQAT
jgi:hypothetical protein